MTTTSQGLLAQDISAKTKGKPAIPISWYGPIFNYSGYAKVSREVLMPMHRRGVVIEATNVGPNDRFIAELNQNQQLAAAWNQMLSTRVERGVGLCFHVPLLHNGADIMEHFRARSPSLSAHIGYTMFETDRLPSGWAKAVSALDRVLVPSQYCRDVFIREGVPEEQIGLLPHGLDWSAYDVPFDPLAFPRRSEFVFLSVFEWTPRKGWDVLLDAWCEAFESRDDVRLLIRASGVRKGDPSPKEQIDAYLAKRGRSRDSIAPIEMIERFIPESEMPTLFRSADAFVLPTRGEGWGLPYLEAMACGLPVIGTRWGGQLDFLHDNNSYLIDVPSLELVPAAFTKANAYYESDHLWASPCRRHTAELMRRVFENRDEAKGRAALAEKEARTIWHSEMVADRLQEECDQVFRATWSRNRQVAKSAQCTWINPLRGRSGFAEEGRHYLFGLDEIGYPVRAGITASVHGLADLTEAEESRLSELAGLPLERSFTAVHHTLPAVSQAIPAADRNVLRAMFETDGLPQRWVERFNTFDELWVPSEFNRQTFERAGIPASKISVLPEALDRRVYEQPHQPLSLPGSGTFRFLSVFDWTLRKGWDLLIRAWLESFKAGDKVTLLLKVHSSLNYDLAEISRQIELAAAQCGRSLDEVADIEILDWNLSGADMSRLFASADAYVMPTRGEGWGRPFFESMAAGTPVIGTAWSGQTAFMDAQNSWLLDYDLVPVSAPAISEASVFEGQNWAEVRIEHLIETMQRVASSPQESQQKATRARREILDRFDRRTVAQQLRTLLN
ncbi:MAG: glycosyltransferase family 4 protein [Planctomycetota bacterium]